MSIKKQNGEVLNVKSRKGIESTPQTNKIVSRADVHYANIHQDFITISEDRLKLYAIAYAKAIENNFFWTLLGIFFTLVTAIYNVNYDNMNYLHWFLICVTAIIGYILFKCGIGHFKKDKIKTPESFVELCKESADVKEWKGNG